MSHYRAPRAIYLIVSLVTSVLATIAPAFSAPPSENVSDSSSTRQSNPPGATDLTASGTNEYGTPPRLALLSRAPFEAMIAGFSAGDNQLYHGTIDNAHAEEFLEANVPLFDCPDQKFNQIYPFRWWTYRKHLGHTPLGWVGTEFLP